MAEATSLAKMLALDERLDEESDGRIAADLLGRRPPPANGDPAGGVALREGPACSCDEVAALVPRDGVDEELNATLAQGGCRSGKDKAAIEALPTSRPFGDV
mmetsp:Transcript_1784/g.4769  ORF Transcript_1784/g.4769 Transcript_1784/m.4769 type:complete len:102 (+) Transcript_1784:403-708(+)|eukprot:scaffold290986_cov26-Tisochrysis_lutea.AAC.1